MNIDPSPDPAPEGASRSVALDLLRKLWRVNHAMETLSKQMLSTLEVTGPQRLLLRLVGERPGLSAGSIAEELELHPSTLTGMLDRLEAGNFLRRTKDPNDGRRAIFRLSAAGKRIDGLSQGTVEAALLRTTHSLREEEVASVNRWLTLFSEELDRERAELSRMKSAR